MTSEQKETPGIITRLRNLNAEKVHRHFRWRAYSLYCWLKRLSGRGYPWWIDRISTNLTFEEKQTLFDLAAELNAGSVLVEIGSYHGASAACLGSASDEKELSIYCIDTWMNDAVSDKREDIMDVFLKNTEAVKHHLTCVRGFSFEVVANIPDEIDLLFIDGDHSYEGVTRDLRLYVPKMKQNGVLVMHDYSHSTVRRAIERYVFPIEVARYVLLSNLYAGRIDRNHWREFEER